MSVTSERRIALRETRSTSDCVMWRCTRYYSFQSRPPLGGGHTMGTN